MREETRLKIQKEIEAISSAPLKYCEIQQAVIWTKYRGRLAKAGQKAGGDCGNGRIRVKIKNKLYLLHRVVFYLHNGWLPEFVDHINQDHTDNRPENLRAATKSQNCMNRKTKRDCKVPLNGVTIKKTGKYVARISVDGKRVYLGEFDNIFDAAACRLSAENKYYGEFSGRKNSAI